MKTYALTVISFLIAWHAITAYAENLPDICDRWVSFDHASYHDDSIGLLRWEFVYFLTNGLVSWQWSRDNLPESHEGRYKLEAKASDLPGQRQRYSITIIPSTLAVRRPITLKDVTVDMDNRVPNTWTVLKFRDMTDTLMTFIRERDSEKNGQSTKSESGEHVPPVHPRSGEH